MPIISWQMSYLIFPVSFQKNDPKQKACPGSIALRNVIQSSPRTVKKRIQQEFSRSGTLRASWTRMKLIKQKRKKHRAPLPYPKKKKTSSSLYVSSGKKMVHFPSHHLLHSSIWVDSQTKRINKRRKNNEKRTPICYFFSPRCSSYHASNGGLFHYS